MGGKGQLALLTGLIPEKFPSSFHKVRLFPSKYRKYLLVSLSVSLFLLTAIYYELFAGILDQIRIFKMLESASSSDRVVESTENMTCHLPRMRAFDPSILQYYEILDPADCSYEDHPPIFEVDRNSIKVVNLPSSYGFERCRYCPAVHDDGERNLRTVNEACQVIQRTTTEVPQEFEFVYLLCQKYGTKFDTLVTAFQLYHDKPEVQKRVAAFRDNQTATSIADGINSQIDPSQMLNILIIGVDAVSHMNFRRNFAQTADYLTKNLSAFEMQGYTKVGDNTFPNLVPALLNSTEEEIKETCWIDDGYFDDCPFIWQDFASRGYRTAYTEDDPWYSTFNYLKKGFKYRPTDYFMEPLLRSDGLPHEDSQHRKVCYGAELGLTYLLRHAKSMAVAMNRTNPYFSFTWSNSLTHDYLNYGQLGDRDLRDSLHWFKENSYLNNTVLIVLSDHGIRWGSIRTTIQGRLEERMPTLFVAFPEWFREKYPAAINSMKNNQNKLTTPFDFYATLKDLLDLNNLRPETLQARQQDLANRMRSNTLPRGISLFLEVPSGRDCVSASIDPQWCVCRELKPISVVNNTDVEAGTQAAVEYLNVLLKDFDQCEKLALKEILSAQIYDASSMFVSADDGSSNNTSASDEQIQKTYTTVTFVVTPSDAIFESTLTKTDKGDWIPSESFSRLNKYGDQSFCVNNSQLKKFCYCKNQIQRSIRQ